MSEHFKKPDYEDDHKGEDNCGTCRGCPAQAVDDQLGGLILSFLENYDDYFKERFEDALQESPDILRRLAEKYMRGKDYPEQTLTDVRTAAEMFFRDHGRLPSPEFASDYAKFLSYLIDYFREAERLRKTSMVMPSEELFIERSLRFAEILGYKGRDKMYKVLEAVKAIAKSERILLDPENPTNVRILKQYLHALGGIDC